MLQIIFQTIEKQVFKKNTQSNDFMPPFSYASKRTILQAFPYNRLKFEERIGALIGLILLSLNIGT